MQAHLFPQLDRRIGQSICEPRRTTNRLCDRAFDRLARPNDGEALLRPRHARVKKFAGEDPRFAVGQNDNDVVVLAALGFVDSEGVDGFDVGQPGHRNGRL